MPIGDPRDGFFYPTLILMMDFYMIFVNGRNRFNIFYTSQEDIQAQRRVSGQGHHLHKCQGHQLHKVTMEVPMIYKVKYFS